MMKMKRKLRNSLGICLAVVGMAIMSISACAESKDQTENKTQNEDQIVEFSTEDLEGNEVTQEIMKDAKVVMINFWEPWCGPCVGEMPELEKLYETYQEDGFLIVGVFTTTGMDDAVESVLEACGITYPVIRSDGKLMKFMTPYVPTTLFTDGDGKVLTEEPYVGAMKYEDWEEILKGYLEETSDEE